MKKGISTNRTMQSSVLKNNLYTELHKHSFRYQTTPILVILKITIVIFMHPEVQSITIATQNQKYTNCYALSLSLSLFISLIQCATLLNAIGKQRKHLIILYYTQNQLCFSTHSPQPVHIYLHTTLLFVLCLKSTMHDNVPIKHILSQFCTTQDLYDSLRVFNQPQAYGILCINYTYIISIIIYYFLIIFCSSSRRHL